MPDVAYESHDPTGKIYESLLTGERARINHIEPMITEHGPQEIVIFEGNLGRIPKDQLHLFWREVSESAPD